MGVPDGVSPAVTPWPQRFVLFISLIAAMVVGFHLLHVRDVRLAEQDRRQCAATVYSLRVILQEIHPAPDADAGLRRTIDQLNHDYAIQYARIYDFLDGDRCVGLLPSTTPPAPTVPGHPART